MSSVAPIAPVPVAPTTARPAAAARRRLRRGHVARRVGINLLGLAVFTVMIFPVYWMVATAFKPGRNIQDYKPHWFPAPATLSNFTNAVHRPYFWTDVKNSLIIVSFVVVLSLTVAFLAALALSRFRFYGRTAFIFLILGTLMVPLAALIIPLYITLSRVHLINTLTGVIAMYMTFVLPFSVWTLQGFMRGVPRELEEAAMVDGSTRFGAFVRILLPLVAPGLVATSIFAFIQAWNEFIIAYVFLHDGSKQTITVWLASFTNLHGTDWGPLMAGATLTALPVVVFFVLIQRRIAFGLTAGAVRG
ncbi:MAG: carbohydrate ABC transporter permease [Actinobacteria bacterium]|nr:MAG: carbohydrate ABC transporter permease [Actinomycetota bacterium]